MSSPDDRPSDAAPEDPVGEDLRPERPAHEDSVHDYATRDQLRAMAHPLRMRIIERVGRRGTARAADLAADLDIPANSMSYHLRTLARGGVIVEAPESARDKRDRVWKLAQTNFQHAVGESAASSGVLVDHDYLEASGATTLAALEWIRSAWVAEIAQRGSHLPESVDGTFAGMFSAPMRLSRVQARELFAAVQQVLVEYNALNRDANGADLPGDPDSDGVAEDVRVLFTMVGERPPPAGPGTGTAGTGAPAADRPVGGEGADAHSSTERPSSRA